MDTHPVPIVEGFIWKWSRWELNQQIHIYTGTYQREAANSWRIWHALIHGEWWPLHQYVRLYHSHHSLSSCTHLGSQYQDYLADKTALNTCRWTAPSATIRRTRNRGSPHRNLEDQHTPPHLVCSRYSSHGTRMKILSAALDHLECWHIFWLFAVGRTYRIRLGIFGLAWRKQAVQRMPRMHHLGNQWVNFIIRKEVSMKNADESTTERDLLESNIRQNPKVGAGMVDDS